MKLINNLILIPLLLIAGSSQAQESAEGLLKKASTLFEKGSTELAFQIVEDGTTLDGTLLMQGNHYRFLTEETQVWFDGKTQWTLQIDPEVKELYISEPTPDEQQSINPYLLLNHYDQKFSASLGKTKTLAQGAKVREVVLTALNNRQELSGMSVYIKENGEPTLLELRFPDGRAYEITIRSFRAGKKLPEKTFTFNAAQHPEIDETIDMR